jgi:uncharacterized protein YgiM (DUF1202 family)
MTHKSLRTLWILTGLVALVLLVATVALVFQAQAVQELRVPARITSASTPVYLRDYPSATQRILTLLNPGTQVIVVDAAARDGRNWYQVEVDEQIGWVPAANVQLSE